MLKSLKANNLLLMTGWVLLHAAILWLLFDKDITFPQILEHLSKFPSTGILLYIAFVFTILLNYIIPSHLKDTLVYWRIFHPLPGCRVFSDLICNDARIDEKTLQESYGAVPSNPNDQNLLWNKLYTKNRNGNTVINSSHQTWLLLRDLTSFVFILIVSLSIFRFFSTTAQEIKHLINIILGLVAEYLLFMIAARNAGNRFAQNVIAEDISNNRLIKDSV